MDRTCNKCNHTGPLETDFPRNKKYKGGYRPQCKTCHNAAAVQWQKANPEKTAVIQKRYNRTDNGIATRKISSRRHAAKRNISIKLWRASNKDHIKSYDFKYNLQYLYSLTVEDFNRLLERQNGTCAICKLTSTNKRLAVDHDHKCCPGRRSCGKCVRGLLCQRCNYLLGQAKDDPVILTSATQYLTQ